MQVGTTTVREAGATSEIEVVKSMRNHNLPCKQCTDLIVICTVDIADSVGDLLYPYKFQTTDEDPTTLIDKF